MGIPPCKCIKSCKDSNEEANLAKEEYLRNKSRNFIINNNPKNLGIYRKSKTISSLTQTINLRIIKETETDKNIKEKVKETVSKIIDENEENKYIETGNNQINTEQSLYSEKINKFLNKINFDDYNLRKNRTMGEKGLEKENSENFHNSKIKLIQKIDINYFNIKKFQNLEKNFTNPIDFEKDIKKYIQDDNDSKEMIELINIMNNSKGKNKTSDDGIILEYKGKKFLYIGEIDNNKYPSGYGILYSKRKKCEGYFTNGNLMGLSRIIYYDGTCYEGIFDGDKLKGKATVIKRDENNKKIEYFGDLVNLKKNGKGEEICEGEYKYIGEFEDDKWNGEGEYENFLTGDKYKGQFEKGEITGEGKYEWSNKETYEGTFVKGIKHGKGLYKWPDGSYYKGEYNNGIREGKGKYKYKDGKIFKGMFKNGVPNGKGKIIFKKKGYDCEFKDGFLISAIK